MPAAVPLKHPVKVGQLVRRRLRELKRTPRELAEAVQVSEDYIVDLVAGRRRPPAPGRIDLYAPMARFLRLHRNDLPTCARVERSAEPAARRRPDPGVWKLLFELCEPGKARLLARQLAKPEGAALEHLIVGRLLEGGCSSSSTPRPTRSRSRTVRTSCATGSSSGISSSTRGPCGSFCDKLRQGCNANGAVLWDGAVRFGGTAL